MRTMDTQSRSASLAPGIARDAEDPRVRCAHGDDAAAGPDLVLHAMHRRGSHRLRLSGRTFERRHELSDLPSAGLADRAGLAGAGHDVPGAVEHKGPHEGPPAS